MIHQVNEVNDEEPALTGESILHHLNELRIRLTWALVSLAVATVISFSFTRPLLEFLIAPYAEQIQTTSDDGTTTIEPERRLQILRPTEGIETYFKVSLVAGTLLSMPFILYQLWLFIAPGLEKQEKRYVYIFIPSGTLLFLIGVFFAWSVLMPAAISFLASFMPSIFSADWTAQEYISFTTSFLVWIGVSFEMPLIIYILSRVGVVTSTTLRQQWRAAIVIIAVLAAAVTPSIDPVTMILTMIPLIILYMLSIVLAAIGQRQFER
jgi:sec-independent protein translocase protein TatC